MDTIESNEQKSKVVPKQNKILVIRRKDIQIILHHILSFGLLKEVWIVGRDWFFLLVFQTYVHNLRN